MSTLQTLTSLDARAQRGLDGGEAKARLLVQGANEIPERRRRPLLRLAKKFWGLSAWMIEAIIVLSLVLHKHADVYVALSLLVVNAVLSFFQEQRGEAALAALRHRLQVTARVLRDGAWRALPARDLVTGDVVRVRAGDCVPADLQLFDGTLRINQAALTGESQDVDKTIDDTLPSGSTVRQGEATGVVVATGAATYFGRTTQLVEGAHPKLHVEEVTARLVHWLLIIVGVLTAVALVTALARGLNLVEVIPVALVLFMSAVPVALPVMFTVSMAVGSMELARRGVLITHLGAIEDAAHMTVLCADKTGTLTMNKVTLTGTVAQTGFTDDDVLSAGALASNESDEDPIDLAFLAAARSRNLVDGRAKRISFAPFSAKTRCTEAEIELEGHKRRVVKGALRTVAEAASLDAGALATLEARAAREAEKGVRVLAVARADADGPLNLVGLAFLYDPPRPDSRPLIDELRALGITVKMLTGDALPVASETARVLGLSAVIRAPELRAKSDDKAIAAAIASADGFAEVYPEDKFLVVKSLQATDHIVGMTGDGVNDAPALRQAEVGIAVSTATDVAKGAASAVLTTEGLGNIVDLVKSGRATYQRLLTWILNKVSRTILKAGFVVIALIATGKFVISALVMLLVVCMTDLAHVALATDHVQPSPKPETWNIGPLVRVSVVLGLMTLAESLALLAVGWHRFGLVSHDGQLQTFTFQTFLFFALFSLLSVRERRLFWRSRPSALLAGSLAAAAAVGAFVGAHGLAELRPLPARESVAIFAFAAICSLGPNDLVKWLLTAHAQASAGRRHAAGNGSSVAPP